MGADDRLDDRQPEPRALSVARALGRKPLERPGEPADRTGVDDGAGVGDRQKRDAATSPGGHLDSPRVRVVREGVVDQVRDETLDQARIAGHRRRCEDGAQVDRAAPCLGLTGEQDLLGQDRQIERVALGETRLPAGEREECLDQAFLLRPGCEHPLVRGPEGLHGRVGVRQRQLDEGPLHGERRAQLVRGVRHELTLGLDELLQPREQRVEGVAEFLELVVRAAQCQPLVQVGGGDAAGGGGDRPQRAEHPSCDEPAERHRQHRHDRQRQPRVDEQVVQVGGVLAVRKPRQRVHLP